MWIRELNGIDALGAARIMAAREGAAFLDSAMRHERLGRFSYVAADPFGTFRARKGRAEWNGTPLAGDPLDALKERLAAFKIQDIRKDSPRVAPFEGGCIGYVAYDFGRQLETLIEPHPAPVPSDDLAFHFYDVVLAFDHREGRAFAIASGLPERDPRAREARAERRLDDTVALLRSSPPAPPPQPAAESPIRWRSNFTPKSYAEAVEIVRDYIRAGDIYQANISQCFEADLPPGFDPWTFYEVLRSVNPATFAAYLDFDDLVVASSSPERFLQLASGHVEARPIKGTAPRSANAADDEAAAAALVASEKDRAENLMIVDLLRNDLSRVCAPGTVREPVLCGLESYASVHHLTSAVTGRLRDGLGACDLIAASFPGGSITGAPKIRAMDIITEIERRGRGVYCGAIGYVGFDGDMDLNIAIRTVSIGAGRASFQAGGGITLLSDPEAEYRETLTKARRIFDAFDAFVERTEVAAASS